MPIIRIVLVLLALASPALAQDGARDAAVAREAAQAFQVYVDGVTKAYYGDSAFNCGDHGDCAFEINALSP